MRRLNRADELKLKQMADDSRFDFETILEVVDTPYHFIREKTRSLDIDRDLTEEEFKKLKTNFNIPCIGKMYASYFLYKKINNGRTNQEESGG